MPRDLERVILREAPHDSRSRLEAGRDPRGASANVTRLGAGAPKRRKASQSDGRPIEGHRARATLVRPASSPSARPTTRAKLGSCGLPQESVRRREAGPTTTPGARSCRRARPLCSRRRAKARHAECVRRALAPATCSSTGASREPKDASVRGEVSVHVRRSASRKILAAPQRDDARPIVQMEQAPRERDRAAARRFVTTSASARELANCEVDLERRSAPAAPGSGSPMTRVNATMVGRRRATPLSSTVLTKGPRRSEVSSQAGRDAANTAQRLVGRAAAEAAVEPEHAAALAEPVPPPHAEPLRRAPS